MLFRGAIVLDRVRPVRDDPHISRNIPTQRIDSVQRRRVSALRVSEQLAPEYRAPVRDNDVLQRDCAFQSSLLRSLACVVQQQLLSVVAFVRSVPGSMSLPKRRIALSSVVICIPHQPLPFALIGANLLAILLSICALVFQRRCGHCWYTAKRCGIRIPGASSTDAGTVGVVAET